MSSAKFGGKGRLLVSSDGGSTYNSVAEILTAELTVEAEQIDVSNHDGGNFREFISGLANWSLSGEANYVESDIAQTAIRAAILGRTAVKVKFRPDVGAGLSEYTGDAYISSVGIPTPIDGQITFPVELQGTGTLTEAAQV